MYAYTYIYTSTYMHLQINCIRIYIQVDTCVYRYKLISYKPIFLGYLWRTQSGIVHLQASVRTGNSDLQILSLVSVCIKSMRQECLFQHMMVYMKCVCNRRVWKMIAESAFDGGRLEQAARLLPPRFPSSHVIYRRSACEQGTEVHECFSQVMIVFTYIFNNVVIIMEDGVKRESIEQGRKVKDGEENVS